MSVAEGGPSLGPEEETYTVPQAAKILRVTDRAVRKWLELGRLEGEKDEAGTWHVPQRAVHARLEDRPPRTPGNIAGGPSAAPEASERADELFGVVRDLERRLGRAEARAELTERAESTLREERDRLLEERDRAHDEARRLREELEAERARARGGFWRRLFGG